MRKRIYATVLTVFMVLFLFFQIEKGLERQRFIAKKIYEVDFLYVDVRDEAMFFYMVCTPPSSAEELIAMINETIPEQQLSELRMRARNYVDALEEKQSLNFKLDGIRLIFLEPYKELGIGVFPEPHTILDYYPEGHTIMIARADMDHGGILSFNPSAGRL